MTAGGVSGASFGSPSPGRSQVHFVWGAPATSDWGCSCPYPPVASRPNANVTLANRVGTASQPTALSDSLATLGLPVEPVVDPHHFGVLRDGHPELWPITLDSCGSMRRDVRCRAGED